MFTSSNIEAQSTPASHTVQSSRAYNRTPPEGLVGLALQGQAPSTVNAIDISSCTELSCVSAA